MILRPILIAIVLSLGLFPSVSFASTVLQNWKRSGESAGNIGYNFPIYGVAQSFTASSTFSFQSAVVLLKSTGVAGYGCAQGYLIQVIGGTYNNVVATSSECIYAEDLTSTFATTTFSFSPYSVTSGDSFILAFEVVGTLPPTADAIKISFMNISPLGSTRCGLITLPSNWSCSSANNVNFMIYDTGGIPPDEATTHILNFLPAEGTTTANPVDFGVDVFIADEDVTSVQSVLVTLHNIDQNVLGVFSIFSNDDIILFNELVTSAGYLYLATTTTLTEGNYRVEACINATAFSIPYPFADLNDCQSHQFVVGTPTFIGNISQNSFTSMNAYYASSSATSTVALAGKCVPFLGFDAMDCLAFLFVPDAYLMHQSMENFKLAVLTHFPLGYVTDFVSIISTSTVPVSLILLDVEVPQGIVGAGAHLTLDATNVLDFVLDATSSQFVSSTHSDSRSFYEITNQYWTYFVFIAALLYILRRVLGSHVIPDFRHMNTYTQDMERGHVSDDAYRYKEKLYEMSQRK